ncbi:sialidase family protein [Jiangella anatolica]|nr:sialidase family protein [Jiangella anatolica]
MSHGLVSYSPGKVLAFNSNVSATRMDGHSGFGWIEYRRSVDAGQTWGEIRDLPYSRDAFLDGEFTISVERAVSPNEDDVIVLCTRNTPYREVCAQPWLTPQYVRSVDGGTTWAPPEELTPYAGRIYDALIHDDTIYVLQFCSEDFIGTTDEHVYRVFATSRTGTHFTELSTVPISGIGRAYGSLLLRADGSMICYAYNKDDERSMDFAISEDAGRTWSTTGSTPVAKGIRNPQTAYLDGVYLLHGRAANGRGFVMYTSSDGLNWDDGWMIEAEKQRCYYSNNIVVPSPEGGDRLLVQYSDAYQGARVNVMHLWVEGER